MLRIKKNVRLLKVLMYKLLTEVNHNTTIIHTRYTQTATLVNHMQQFCTYTLYCSKKINPCQYSNIHAK